MAVRFDAVTDYLSRSTSLPPIASWTVAAWFRIVVEVQNYCPFIAFGAVGGSIAVYELSTIGNGITISTWNNATEVLGSTLSIGVWYHLAVTVAGTGAGQFKTYLDGALDITNDGNAALAGTELWIGADSTGIGVSGRVAAVKIWDVPLTQAEIQQEMHTIRPQRFANLNAWYPCFPGATERLADYSGNGRNWTANGTLTDEDPPPVSWGAPVWTAPFVAPAGGPETFVMPIFSSSIYG